jgi:hypothetical protein
VDNTHIDATNSPENNMSDWHNISITDKSGKEFFKVVASPMATHSEIKNLQRHLDQAQRSPKAYSFLDVATAHILLDGAPYGVQTEELDADALLAELDAIEDLLAHLHRVEHATYVNPRAEIPAQH